MSYTELHKGKLVPVKDYLSTGEFLEWLESNEGFYVDDLEEKVEDEYDTLEVFNNEDVLVYLFTKNVLYKVTDYSGGEYCSEEINQTIKQPDGSIDFMYMFYNGGTCFSEMLEEGLERIEQSNTTIPNTLEVDWIPLNKNKLPDDGAYWVVYDNSIISGCVRCERINDSDYWKENVTHYYPVSKPINLPK